MTKHKDNIWKAIVPALIGVGFIFLLIFLAVIMGRYQINKPTPLQQVSKECQYECCIGTDYVDKLCDWGYQCENFRCLEIDTDGDGLSDIEEKNLGTNYRLSDTDFDTLTDYQEVYQTRTNPTKENTDNDRYRDAEDQEPFKTNSADVVIQYGEPPEDLDPEKLAELVEVATNYKNPIWWITKVTKEQTQTKPLLITITNKGDDYTNYVSFDVVTYAVIFSSHLEGIFCSEKKKAWEGEISSDSFNIEQKIMPGKTITTPINVPIEVVREREIIPNQCSSFLCFCNTTKGFVIKNIKYERFN